MQPTRLLPSMQSTQPHPNLNRQRDILLLIVTCVGILGLLIRGTTLVVSGMRYLGNGDVASLASSMLGAIAMLFCAVLLLPVLIYTLKRLKGLEIPPANIQPVKVWQVVVSALVWVFVVVIGAVLVNLFVYGWIVAAPLFLLGISIPIFLLSWIGVGGLHVGSRRRLWSAFAVSMVGSTVAALLLEYLVVGIAILVVGILAATNPELLTTINQIKTQIANTNAGDIQSLLTVLAPYITNPLVIVTIMTFAAVLAPVIEESLKPAVIWFLGKHLRSPAEGFALGVLCGAGFAMLEGLMAASGTTQMWGFGLAGRAVASLMHVTSSGLLGWAIASARLEKRYGRLAVIYLLSVSIHGLWNGSAIMAVYGALRTMVQTTQIDFPGMFFMLGGLGMLFLELVVMSTTLPLFNRHLRQSAVHTSEQVQSDIIAPLTTSNPREPDGLDS